MVLASPHDMSAQPQRGRDAVTGRAVAAKATLRPGDQIVIAVVYQHRPDYHTWPNEPVVPPELGAFTPIPTTLEIVAAPSGAEVQPIQWPIQKRFA